MPRIQINMLTVFLVENQSSPILFRVPQVGQVADLEDIELPNIICKGLAELVIKCKDSDLKGSFFNGNDKFPWTTSVSALSKRLRGKNNCFSLHTTFALLNYRDENAGYGLSPPKMMIRIEGDFPEIFKFVFDQVPKQFKLNFEATFKFGQHNPRTTTLHYQMDGVENHRGDIIFEASPDINPDFARNVARVVEPLHNDRTVSITMELVGVDADADSTTAAFGVGGTENLVVKKILEAANNTGDFELVTENGIRFSAHKMFLEAASPFFKRMFDTECKETKEKACTLQLTEDAVKILREFIYCGSIESVEEKPDVAMELLECAHSKEITSLEEALKKLVLRKRDDWLDFSGALQLFVKAVQWGEGYDGVKKKAARAIKLTPEEIRTSSECEELFKTDWKSAMELLYFCSQQFPDNKSEGEANGTDKKMRASPDFSPPETDGDEEDRSDFDYSNYDDEEYENEIYDVNY